MLKGSKYCNDVMKKGFEKELAIIKKDDDDFEKSTKCLIYDNVYLMVMLNKR